MPIAGYGPEQLAGFRTSFQCDLRASKLGLEEWDDENDPDEISKEYWRYSIEVDEEKIIVLTFKEMQLSIHNIFDVIENKNKDRIKRLAEKYKN